jgi:hypothetical protein
VPELLPAPPLDPNDPEELPLPPLEPPKPPPGEVGELEEGPPPWLDPLLQAERPVETARPEMARRKRRRRECICLLRYAGMSASRPYGSTRRQ